MAAVRCELPPEARWKLCHNDLLSLQQIRIPIMQGHGRNDRLPGFRARRRTMPPVGLPGRIGGAGQPMPLNKGHINYALVERSKRLQRVIDLLKKADHPLSGMEIQIQAWVTNASTSIAEIRGEKNRAAGYEISPARAWKGGQYPWHDGNPRYWLIAAPGWHRRWTITHDGLILPYTEHGREETGTQEENEDNVPAKTAQGLSHQAAQPGPVETQDKNQKPEGCKLKRCGRPIPEGKPGNTSFCCDAHRNEYWKNLRELGKAVAGLGQIKMNL